MNKIELQRKTHALNGSIQTHWFENENIDLPNTLFHRITIPLAPFDSGLDYEKQPVETQIVFDWYKLDLPKPDLLDGLNLSHKLYPKSECSIYIGNAYNWCVAKCLLLCGNSNGTFNARGAIFIEFENELVAKNECFRFEVELDFSRNGRS